MGLFSDIDWMIIAGLGAFLLLGRDGGATVRQLGRWYGRAMRLKQELLSEVARAADLPIGAGGNGGSLRAALLGLETGAGARAGIPAAVRVAPGPPMPPEPSVPLPLPWTGGSPVTSWSATFFANETDGRFGR